jgi:DNA polymerase-3 subunit epsilon
MSRTGNRTKAQTSQTWARRLAHHDGWVVLDLETTGLGPRAQPVEVAVVGPGGDLVLQSLVRPECEIEPEAVRLHGLDAAALSSAPGFLQIYPGLRRVLAGRVVIAYWAVFDRSVLHRACKSAALPLLGRRWECGHERYAAWRGFSAPLSTACEIEGIAVTGRHRAADDARLLWNLLQRMAQTPS